MRFEGQLYRCTFKGADAKAVFMNKLQNQNTNTHTHTPTHTVQATPTTSEGMHKRALNITAVIGCDTICTALATIPHRGTRDGHALLFVSRLPRLGGDAHIYIYIYIYIYMYIYIYLYILRCAT